MHAHRTYSTSSITITDENELFPSIQSPKATKITKENKNNNNNNASLSPASAPCLKMTMNNMNNMSNNTVDHMERMRKPLEPHNANISPIMNRNNGHLYPPHKTTTPSKSAVKTNITSAKETSTPSSTNSKTHIDTPRINRRAAAIPSNNSNTKLANRTGLNVLSPRSGVFVPTNKSLSLISPVSIRVNRELEQLRNELANARKTIAELKSKEATLVESLEAYQNVVNVERQALEALEEEDTEPFVRYEPSEWYEIEPINSDFSSDNEEEAEEEEDQLHSENDCESESESDSENDSNEESVRKSETEEEDEVEDEQESVDGEESETEQNGYLTEDDDEVTESDYESDYESHIPDARTEVNADVDSDLPIQLNQLSITQRPTNVLETTELGNEDEEGSQIDDINNDDDNDDTSHPPQSSNTSISLELDEVEGDCFGKQFPYESNLCLLARFYYIAKRLFSCPDAVTYKAIDRSTGKRVVIKLCTGYRKDSVPKEVRILNRAQGHPNIMQLLAWFAFPKTQCYAIVSAWIENESIEDALFNEPALVRKYMHDLLVALSHLHSRGILYRDIKPSNVLWSSETNHGIMIDYDVATFYDHEYLHRLAVGTDGYMAPELHAVSKRSKTQELPENDPYASLQGYTQAVDAYGAGMVLGQLIFEFTEDLVADNTREDVKGEAFLKLIHERQLRNQPITLAEDLMCRLLCRDPAQRITVEDALHHPYFNDCT